MVNSAVQGLLFCLVHLVTKVRRVLIGERISSHMNKKNRR